MHYKDSNHLVAALLTGLFTMPGCGADGMTDTATDGPGDCEAALEKGQLVISEIMADPHGADDSSFEWFELYNSTQLDLSLTGIGLEYSKLDGTGGKGHLIKEPLTLPAGGYMAFGKATAETSPQYIGYGYGADLGSLGNTAGKLRVVCGKLTVDEVLYQDLKDGYSRNLGTHPPDAETNDDLNAWCLASAAYQADEYGSPGAENPSCPLPPTECGQCYENGQLRASKPPTAGQLVISEIMPNAKLTDGTVGEWFELTVLGGPVDLNCLQYGANTTKFLADPTRPDQTIQTPECITVDPGTIELFAEHEEWPGADFDVKFAIVDSPSTSNPNPGIYVAYDGKILDEAHYKKTTDGAAWSLDPDALTPAGNDDPVNWCLAVDVFAEGDLGTPGAENPQCPEVVRPGTCLGADAKPRDIDYAAPGELMVTEILTAPGLGDHTLSEWIELVVVADLDLNGITLGKTLETPYTTIADPACLPIPAGTTILLAKTDDTSTNGMLPIPDWIGPKIALTNDNSTLVVGVNDQQTMTVTQLDAITWANTADGKARQFPVGLIPNAGPIDVTINDDPTAWCDATQPFGVGDFGTPKADNLDCDGPPPGDQCMDAKTMKLRPIQHPGVGDLIITELHADPDALIKSGGAGESTGEWFEIYAAVDFDLNGAILGNTFPTKKHTVTSDTCLPVLADSYALLASVGKPTVPPNAMDSGGTVAPSRGGSPARSVARRPPW